MTSYKTHLQPSWALSLTTSIKVTHHFTFSIKDYCNFTPYQSSKYPSLFTWHS